MRQSQARLRGVAALARIVSWAQAGVDPKIMGTGPIPAIKKAVSRSNFASLCFTVNFFQVGPRMLLDA